MDIDKYDGKVALYHGPNKEVELLYMQWPLPNRNEALVKISHCAICRSDVHTICGRRHAQTPSVLGHEIIGKLVAMGDTFTKKDFNGQRLNLGDRITWTIYSHCGTCFFCQNNLPQKCASLFKYGHEAVSETGQGSSGGMADYIMIRPGTAVLKLPETISDYSATPINCAVATAAAMIRESNCRIDLNTTTIIMGGGYAGLSAVALAKYKGCGRILVFEINIDLHQRCLNFGADAVFIPGDPKAVDLINQWTQQRGVDLVLELAGSTDAAQFGLNHLRTGGCLVLGGTVFPSPPLRIDPDQIVRRCLSIKGSHNYHPEDLITATDFLNSTQQILPWGELVGAVFTLEDCNAAIQYAKDNPGKRAIFQME